MTDLEPGSDNVYASDVKVIGTSVYVAGDYYNETVGAHACVWQVDLDAALLGRTDLGTTEFTKNGDRHGSS